MSTGYTFIPGDLAHLKVSGEVVVVITHLSGSNQYEVRRCIRRKLKGTRYQSEWFFGFELETPEDHLLKRKQEMDDLAKALKGAGAVVLDDRPKGPSYPPNFDNRTH